MASIKVKFRPSTASGREGSIYYQVIHGRIVRQVKTDYRIFDTEWDKRTSSVKILSEIGENRKRYLREVTEHIDWDTRRLKAIVAQCDRQGGIYSADSIIEKFNRQTGEQSLFRFMQGLNVQRKQIHNVRTLKAPGKNFRIEMIRMGMTRKHIHTARTLQKFPMENAVSIRLRILPVVKNQCKVITQQGKSAMI